MITEELSELSEYEQALVDSLVDPDAPESTKYGDDKPIQQEILCLMVRDKYFMDQSFGLIKPDYFVDKAHSLICRIVVDFFEENKRKLLPTKSHIVNEIKLRLKDNPTVGYYIAELQAVIDSYEPELSPRDTLLHKIGEFAKQQGLRAAIGTVVDLVQKKGGDKKWVEIEEILRTALLIGPNTDLGLEYFASVEERYERMMKEDAETERFSSGFKSIDEGLVGGGLSRGEIGAYMGMPGTGKSVALVKASVVNLNRGKRVLYISLEMDQDKIAERFDTMLTNVPINQLKERYTEVFHALKLKSVTMLKEQGDIGDRRLYVKQFAAGSADVTTVRAFVSQLALFGFVPDLVIIDYVGEFKDLPGMKKYESLQRMVRDLRGWAVEEKICILTAMQPNRSGRNAQESSGFIDDSEIGDAFGQSRPMDAIWSINMNKIEQQQKVGRIFVVKHRHGRSRYHFHFQQDKDTLDMVEIDQTVWNNEMSKHTDAAAGKAADGMGKKGNFKPNDDPLNP
jgi:replicative DNA helicase